MTSKPEGELVVTRIVGETLMIDVASGAYRVERHERTAALEDIDGPCRFDLVGLDHPLRDLVRGPVDPCPAVHDRAVLGSGDRRHRGVEAE